MSARNFEKMKIKYRVTAQFTNNKKRTATFLRKSSIRNFSKDVPVVKWFLDVDYGRGYHNRGTFNTKKEMLEALNMWTEEGLLEYINE